MVCEKTARWSTVVLLVTVVIGAAGCGDASNEQQSTSPNTMATASQGEKPAAAPMPAMTAKQKQALASAQRQVHGPMGLSKKDLIEQLRNDGGFSKADAMFAADQVDVDWNQQALLAVNSASHPDGRGGEVFYLDEGQRAKDALIRDLRRDGQFTPAQVRYAVDAFYGPAGTMLGTPAQEAESAKPPAPTRPATTAAQKAALATAQRLIDEGGVSKKQLVEILRWGQGRNRGYSKADATFAADNAAGTYRGRGVDWNVEALQSASYYLRSREGLLRPLSADELFRRLTLVFQFTPPQARYAVHKIY